MSKGGSHITQLIKDSIYFAAKDGRAINIYTALEELTVPQVKQLLNEVGNFTPFLSGRLTTIKILQI